MADIHVVKNTTFVRDSRLSWKARGILAYLVDHEDGWQISVQDILAQSQADGRIAVQSAMQELVKYNYAKLELIRDMRGRVKGKKYRVYQTAYNEPHPAQVDRQSGNLPVGTDEHINRQSGNLPVGENSTPLLEITDAQENCLSAPTSRFYDSQETCSTTKDKNQEKRTKPKPKTKPSPQHVAETPYSEQFLLFWDAYPQKKDKGEAWKVWHRDKLDAIGSRICASVKEHQIHDTQWQRGYIKYPAHFLNAKCWEDEFQPIEAIIPPRRVGGRFVS